MYQNDKMMVVHVRKVVHMSFKYLNKVVHMLQAL
jgi:hypothetical protein